MDSGGGGGVMGSCGVLVVCSLLLKTLRSLLMGRVCSRLIAGLQLLSRDLKAKEAEHVAVKKNVFVRLPVHGPHKGCEQDMQGERADGRQWQVDFATCVQWRDIKT